MTLFDKIAELQHDPMIGKFIGTDLVVGLAHQERTAFFFARWTATRQMVEDEYAHWVSTKSAVRTDIEATTDTRG